MPGAFRTNFLSAFVTPQNQGHRYPTADNVLEHFNDFDGKQPGDTVKGAKRIVETVAGNGMAGHLLKTVDEDGHDKGIVGRVVRLPLGSDCVERYEAKLEDLKEDLCRGREVAHSTAL